MAYKDKQKQKEYHAKWYAENRENVKTQHVGYKQANRSRILARAAAYRESHRAEASATLAKWQKANPEKARAAAQRRRAKKASVVRVPIRTDMLSYLIEVWANLCAYCRNTSDKWEIDHFIPIDLKGHHAEYNLVLACPPCNSAKGAKHPFLFIKERKLCFTFKPYMRFIAEPANDNGSTE